MAPGQAAADAVRRQVEKIAASPQFAHAARMCRFLRLVVDYTLAGRGGELKEYLLGTEVFGRPVDYDARLDPIVRVEARRLRAKLREYYASEGGGDEVTIEVPTGSYVPTFRTAGGAQPAAAPSPAGIAVLPFTNLSAEPDHEYFSDGLTEELIHRLTQVEGLRVVAWHSAARLKGPEWDFGAVGDRLRVATVLSGSVRRSGDRLRITAQLIETATGAYLWSQTYDRRLHDLFAIQEEIALAIIDALQMRLSAPGAARKAHNLDAYNLYLKGRFHWNKRTVEGMWKSVECYEAALALEPEMAVCYAGLADSFTVLSEYGALDPATGVGRARATAERALSLDPLLGEAEASLGLILSAGEWDWQQAGRHYRRAIQLNPGYASAHHWYSVDYLAMLGREAEARAEIDIAVRLDPLSAIILEGKGYLDLVFKNYERAIAIYQEILELDPSFAKAIGAIGRARIQTGQYQDAIASLQKCREMGGDMPNVVGALGQAYALAGNTDEARAMLACLASIAVDGYVPASCFAVVHLGLGERAEALTWLERGEERRDLSLISLKVHPVYDALRAEARFQAIVQRVFGR